MEPVLFLSFSVTKICFLIRLDLSDYILPYVLEPIRDSLFHTRPLTHFLTINLNVGLLILGGKEIHLPWTIQIEVF